MFVFLQSSEVFTLFLILNVALDLARLKITAYFWISSVLCLLPAFCDIMSGDSSSPHASGVAFDFVAVLGSLTTSTLAVVFRDISNCRTLMTRSQGESLADIINSASLSTTIFFTSGFKLDPLSLVDVKIKVRPSVKGKSIFT